MKRSLWDLLVRALRVPVRLPCLVWISSGRGSAVVRRSSRSLRGFGASLPVAWSHPTLVGIKLVILRYSQQVILWFPTYYRKDRATPRRFPSVPCCWWSLTLIMWYQSSSWHGRSCHHPHHYPCLIYLIYLCLFISYSPRPHKKNTYNHFAVLLRCVLCSSSC